MLAMVTFLMSAVLLIGAFTFASVKAEKGGIAAGSIVNADYHGSTGSPGSDRSTGSPGTEGNCTNGVDGAHGNSLNG